MHPKGNLKAYHQNRFSENQLPLPFLPANIIARALTLIFYRWRNQKGPVAEYAILPRPQTIKPTKYIILLMSLLDLKSKVKVPYLVHWLGIGSLCLTFSFQTFLIRTLHHLSSKNDIKISIKHASRNNSQELLFSKYIISYISKNGKIIFLEIGTKLSHKRNLMCYSLN